MSIQNIEPVSTFLSNFIDGSRIVSSTAIERIPQLDEKDLRDVRDRRPLILDLRNAHEFSAGFIPGSINTPVADRFICFPPLDSVIDRILYLIAEDEAAVLRFISGIGVVSDTQIRGWFSVSILNTWQAHYGALSELETVAAETLAIRNSAWKTLVIDFRACEAYDCVRIPDSICLPATNVGKSVAGLPLGTNITVVANSEAEASFVASVLRSLRYEKVSVLQGGFDHYLEQNLPLDRKRSNRSALQYT